MLAGGFGCILAGYLFEGDAALDLLEPVFERSTGNLVNTAKTDPDLDPLRGNPRFEKMLATPSKGLRYIHGFEGKQH